MTIRTALIALALLLTLPLAAQTIHVDATTPIPPPETGYLHAGGTSSTGHSLQVNSRYLLRDGHPWLPVMGELHYTRVPESEWEDEILKMKAAGIDIVSTYVFWIHHEEVEGHFDWTGRRDLRRFVQLCGKHGMYVWVRPGPWAHGEVRNGGFPDWLATQPNIRTNDPAYLAHVTRLFTEIGNQLHGLMFKDGGPVIGAQLENEYGQHGPGRGAEHILKLKQIALAAGIDPPLFSVTGWPSLDFPPQEVIPVSGGYPDGFWFGDRANLPPSINYLFNFNRELGDMGATVPSEDPTGKVNLAHDPYFAAEQAGGMASAYHRRPILTADDIAALTLTGIGSGINLYGYYMFHGGQNPTSVNPAHPITLQESVASGYPNDLPQLTYDFNAPIGEFGQLRESYRKTRLLQLFLNAYGPQLAPMPAYAPTPHTRNPADTSTARVAVRTDGHSGFVFVNNYVRQLSMPARPGFQVQVKLPTGTVAVPATPVDIPANTYFAWPFNLPLGTATLQWSTAQLLTRLDTPEGPLVVFSAIPGIPAQFALDPHTVKSITAIGGKTVRTPTAITVTDRNPGIDCKIKVTDTSGATTTLLILTRQMAEQTTLLHIGTEDHLALTPSTLLFDGTALHLRSTASPTQQVLLLPAIATATPGKGLGLWTSYTLTQPVQHPELAVTQIQPAAPRPKMDMGPYVDWRKTAVPTVPPDAAFDQAATWHLQWKNPSMKGLSEVLLQVEVDGDAARLYTSSGTLLEDTYLNGLPWQTGLKRFATPTDLTLRILPLPPDAPIYLDPIAHRPTTPNPNLRTVKLLPEYESTLQLK